MHPHIMSKAMLVRDQNDRPLFQTATEAPAPGAIGRILGYPVQLCDAAPSTNAASAKVAVFGDPLGLAVGIRQDLEMAQSEHLRFAENQIVYRALMRAGTIVKNYSTTVKPFAILTLPAL
jgi:HK97 family phage major capsid protein